MKWLAFRSWLNRILDMVPTDVIAYEQAHHRGGAATHCIHAMIGVVETVAAERNIEVTNRHTGSIKKHATGKGSSGKGEMIAAARMKWQNVEDDNHADALWLLDLMQAEITV
jgi:Holliday junction resolvasome RuvABC endonuclease subunit